jgi:integral membrane protein (TIGR01906 family)
MSRRALGAPGGAVQAVRKIATLFFIVALPIAFLTANIRLAVNAEPVYEYATDHYDTVETTGISRQELLRASAELRSYFNTGEGAISTTVIQDGESVALYNDRETQHLRDVRDLFRLVFRVQEASLLFISTYVVLVFIWAREGTLRRLAREALIASAAGLAVLAGAGVVVLAGFESAFERFHLVAFDNDLWKLDPSRDRLIQMFPENFWYDLTVWIAAVTFVELALTAIVSGIALWLTHEPRSHTVQIRGSWSDGNERVEA